MPAMMHELLIIDRTAFHTTFLPVRLLPFMGLTMECADEIRSQRIGHESLCVVREVTRELRECIRKIREGL